MSDLLRAFQSSIPSARDDIASLWLAMWAHPDGLALTQILDNISLSIEEWCQRFPQVEGADTDAMVDIEALKSWSECIAAIKQVTPNLPEPSQQAIERGPGKNLKSHPLSKHGLTAHGIYSGCWNRHESSDARRAGLSDMPDAGPALRCIQLYCVQAQASLVQDYEVSLGDYLIWLDFEQDRGVHIDKPENSAKLDFFQVKYAVNTSAVGRALRYLSFKRHQPLLQCIDACFQISARATLQSLCLMDSERQLVRWRADDAVIQKEREDIVSNLRLFFEHIQGSDIKDKRRRARRAKKESDSKHNIKHGYLGAVSKLIPVESPELLPELDDWVTTDEVIIEDDGDDTEPPKRTGLQLVRPEDVAGHLAKLKTQQHYCAMLRQNFAWDNAALSDSEHTHLRTFLHQLVQTAQSQEVVVWLPKAMVAVSWLLGRSLAETAQMRVVDSSRIKQSELELAVSDTEQGIVWRLPLKTPSPSGEQYEGRLERVNHIVVPDISGLGAAIVDMHKRRQVKSELVFAWTRNVNQREALAKLEIKQLDDQAGAKNRVLAVRIARSLRITLLNLVPDRTIAWMVAGTTKEAIEPRMFYASHTPDELRAWTLKAQAQLLQLSDFTAPDVPLQTLSSVADRVSKNAYAGARFMPELKKLQKLCTQLRWYAQQLPPMHVVNPAHKPLAFNHTPERHAQSFSNWDTVECWRQWHDDVVLWVWLVQTLTTGMRAITHPSHLYYQWLINPEQEWLALEDKITRDHDESRAAWLSPLLREAFATLAATQEAYASRWLPKPQRKSRRIIKKLAVRKKATMPYGFVVFGDEQTPKPLRPRWVIERLKRMIDVDWPANFSRAILRRALAERGLTGDALDAFLGHGAMAERVHDRHSMFETHLYAQQLQAALQGWSNAIGLVSINHRMYLSVQSSRFRHHRHAAIVELDHALGFAELDKEISDLQESKPQEVFDQWCDAVHKLTDADKGSLRALRQWHALLLDSIQPFSKYLLLQVVDPQSDDGHRQTSRDFIVPAGQVSQAGVDDSEQGGRPDLSTLSKVQRMQADALEGELVQALLDGKLNRPQTAFGFNLAYKICRALDPEMPTMRLALSAAARVSPFTTERLQISNKAHDWLKRCRRAIRPNDPDRPKGKPRTDSTIQLALASFLNVTSNASRWRALVQSLVVAENETLPPTNKPFGQPFEYKVTGLGRKIRLQRGFVDVISMCLTPDPSPVDAKGIKDLFAYHKPRFVRGPKQIGTLTNGIHWWSRLLLPPLVAEHFAGVLNDQSASGPWGQRFAAQLGAQELVTPRQKIETTWHEQAVMPIDVVLDPARLDPIGWDTGHEHPNGEAVQWLRRYLLSQVGAQHPDRTLQLDQPTSALLNEALTSAAGLAPGKYRPALQTLVAQIRKNCNLEVDPDAEDAGPGVDRHVVDWDTYDKFLTELDKRCITGRFIKRLQRLRLLIVMAFRFGMRRQEILGLRRIDVDLVGSGRIHVRPYRGHPLKTGFSERCLPISVLLPVSERSWLVDACHGIRENQLLFPQNEHDTLPRDAIALIRQVAGDPLLKLHHLRHSFASLLTLKVVLARHPDWADAFIPWQHTWQALQKSPDLIGALIKPHNAAADLLVVPRLLGHSSYEVTLTNYTHSLEVVGALYQAHVVSQSTLPDRELGLLLHRRFESAKSMRDQAMTWPVGVSEGAHLVDAVSNHSKSRAEIFEDLLRSLLVRCQHGEAADVYLSTGLRQADLVNWFTPRQGTALREKLIMATSLLEEKDAKLLTRLGRTYWQADPPMYWFSEARHEASNSAGGTLVDDALSMIHLLFKVGFGRQDIGLWRYGSADESVHSDFWHPVLAVVGLKNANHLRRGRATTVQSLGITLGTSGQQMRSQLLGVWWRGCAQLKDDVSTI